MEEPLNRHNSVLISNHKSRLSVFGEISKNQLPRITQELSPIHPEVCLVRKNILEEDKKKRFHMVFTSKTPRDISHMLDFPIKPAKKSVLPNSLQEMKKWLFEGVSRNPTGIKEIESLEKWLNEMKKVHLPDIENMLVKDLPPSQEFIEKVETVYFVALAELLRQVSVQCKSRAELLKDVIGTLEIVWKKQPAYLNEVINGLKENYGKSYEDLKIGYKKKVDVSKESIKALEKKLEHNEQEKDALNAEISSLKKYISKMHWEYEEFFKFKNKQSKLVHSFCQTEIILEDYTNNDKSENESLSRESSFSASDLDSPVMKIAIHKSSSDLIDENEQLKLIEDVKKSVKEIDIGDIDIQNIIGAIAKETKNLNSWANGFKFALTLIPTRAKSSSELSPQMNSPTINKSRTEGKPQMLSRSSRNLTITTKFKDSIGKKSHEKSPFDSHFITPRENNAAVSVIKTIVSQPISKLSKYSKTTNKKIIKHINNYIYAAIAKKYSKGTSFSEFAFGKFLEKYNIKALAEKKFQEFLTGCLLYYNESRKICLFLRSLNAGSKYDLPDLSAEGCEMFIRLYDFMISSRVGVILDLTNPLSSKYFPLSRALECLKIKFECIYTKQDYSNLLEHITKLSINDHSSINKSGIIDLDEFIYIAINSYEKYVTRIKTGVQVCLKIATDYNYVSKGEAALILRNICPARFSSIFKQLPFDTKNELSTDYFTDTCIANGLLSSETVSEFFSNYKKNTKEILEFIHKNEEKICRMVISMTEDTLTVEEWQCKFEDLNFKLRGTEPTKYLQLWHLLRQEIDYLRSLT